MISALLDGNRRFVAETFEKERLGFARLAIQHDFTGRLIEAA